jgi:hypothetical protein
VQDTYRHAANCLGLNFTPMVSVDTPSRDTISLIRLSNTGKRNSKRLPVKRLLKLELGQDLKPDPDPISGSKEHC